jgi:hypothetical protein
LFIGGFHRMAVFGGRGLVIDFCFADIHNQLADEAGCRVDYQGLA